MTGLEGISRVIFADFEFSAPPGELPRPICVVFREQGQASSNKVWLDSGVRREPPYEVDRSTLFVAYYASAEIGCHLALKWPLPIHVLDLYTEFRRATNGRDTPCGSGLLGALAYYGLDSLSAVEKTSMRELAIRGGPWSDDERSGLLDYCETDVVALERLMTAMVPSLDLDRALLRGRFMAAAAHMESAGVPIDTEILARFVDQWADLKFRVIEQVDRDYGVFVGGRFNSTRWGQWLGRNGIPWPHNENGRLLMDDDTFRDMARSYPAVHPMRQLRQLLSQMRPPALTVGHDDRNRCLLSAFRSRTGRNQPSNSRFIFGAPSWMRGLIRPARGYALAYIDWSQQEFGIAAALSGDTTMMEAYRSGDPYLAFARQAGAVPPGATKQSHGDAREQFKACVLGVQYGMGPETLARRIGRSASHAGELLELHRRTYPQYWRWVQAAMDTAMLSGQLDTVYGWTYHVSAMTRWRTLANFPMQANGAEMLRLACIFAIERGVKVCAPVHDAILIEAPEAEITHAVAVANDAMARASRAVLDGFELRADVRVLRYPERLIEPRGELMWQRVVHALAAVESPARALVPCCTSATEMVHA